MPAGDTPPPFALLLRRYRQAAGLTQEELAERAHLSVGAISTLERGLKHTPRKDTLALIAGALALSPDEQAILAATARRARAPAQDMAVPALAGAPVASTAPGDRDGGAMPPLVGRMRELALLQRHLAGEGPPLLLLAGEPGIGKSRLLWEATVRARKAGWRVLSGSCNRGGGQEPYAPLLQALQRCLDTSAPAQRRTDLLGCAWLVRFLPELAEEGIEPLPNWTLPPEQERRLMFKAVTRFLTNVAGPEGTLLVLDDLHWAGADALDLLAVLVRAAGSSLRVVGAYRNTELQERDPLAGTLAELARTGFARHHELPPLTPREGRQLLAALLQGGEDDRAALAERVARRAGGIPFYLVSCAQALCLDGAEPGEDSIPWDVEQSIRQRVVALPMLAREALSVAAVAGRVMPAALLTAVVGQPEPAVLAALDAACQARMLTEVELDYQFAHDLIREVIEATMGRGRRMALHRRIAEILERQAADSGAEPPLAMLAYHYGHSSAQDKALLYLELAGDRARDQAAAAAAEWYYRELVRRLDGLGRVLDGARVREKLGGVLATTACYDAALAVLEQAVETARAAGDLESLGRVTACMGHIHYNRGTPAEGIARLQPLLERLEARGPSSALAMLHASLAELNLHSGQWAEELVAAERAGQVAHLVGDVRCLARAEYLRGGALTLMGRAEEALPVAEEAIRLAEAAGELDCLCDALSAAALLHEVRGEFQHVRRYAEREFLVAERLGDPVFMADSVFRLGLIAFYSGDWDQARGYYAQAQAIHRQISIAPTSCAAGSLLVVLGQLRYVEGAWEEASRYLEEGRIIFYPQGKRSGLRWAQGVLAERDILAGQPEAAHARLVPLLDRWGVEEGAVTAHVLPVLAWAYLELGDTDQAVRTVGDAIRRARAGLFRISLADALRVQALVALRQGRWAEAERALEEGLSLARHMPYPYAEARLLQVYGNLRDRQGEPGPARERLMAALALFRRLGARKDAERTEQSLLTLG